MGVWKKLGPNTMIIMNLNMELTLTSFLLRKTRHYSLQLKLLRVAFRLRFQGWYLNLKYPSLIRNIQTVSLSLMLELFSSHVFSAKSGAGRLGSKSTCLFSLALCLKLPIKSSLPLKKSGSKLDAKKTMKKQKWKSLEQCLYSPRLAHLKRRSQTGIRSKEWRIWWDRNFDNHTLNHLISETS